MADSLPKLSLMEDPLITKDMLKSTLALIIKMTSGVVYSILMNCLIITAYAFLFSQSIFTSDDQFVKDPLNGVSGCIGISCMYFGMIEVICRWSFRKSDQLLVTKYAHLHHIFMYMLFSSSSLALDNNPRKALNCFYVGGSLMVWTFFVLVAVVIHVALLEDESLKRKMFHWVPSGTFIHVALLEHS